MIKFAEMITRLVNRKEWPSSFIELRHSFDKASADTMSAAGKSVARFRGERTPHNRTIQGAAMSF